ncbi:ankyrin repeat domain-containing protein 45-like isoform X3 [Biomphalaria glabrata]|uniref:Ankyrin repeat domain-containing protein 45-like isoform X3 n=1 Tax=Biomphalaria glabrata TaxID=6526 RepID=A0A9W3BDK5_BIOGL|nr:ankyrin repeat domain-containing protein 45-like isoform X3 [Biomphalaria glabrata]
MAHLATTGSVSHTIILKEEEEFSPSMSHAETDGETQELENDSFHSRADLLTEQTAKLSRSISMEENDPSETALESNIVMQCIYKNNLERLQECFQNELDHHRKELLSSLNQRDLSGKSPLDVAACLGRFEIIQFLISIGAEVNSTSSKGYTCLHYAAAWGRKSVLKLLVEKGGNFHLRNIFEERPREVANRYNQNECVYFLDWADAKVKLEDTVSKSLEMVNEQDKNATVKLTKEEKFIVINTCKEKQEWMDKNKEPSIQDYEMHLTSFLNIVQPILQKIIEQASVSMKDASLSRPLSRVKYPSSSHSLNGPKVRV